MSVNNCIYIPFCIICHSHPYMTPTVMFCPSGRLYDFPSTYCKAANEANCSSSHSLRPMHLHAAFTTSSASGCIGMHRDASGCIGMHPGCRRPIFFLKFWGCFPVALIVLYIKLISFKASPTHLYFIIYNHFYTFTSTAVPPSKKNI
jgi:hypothetical protein